MVTYKIENKDLVEFHTKIAPKLSEDDAHRLYEIIDELIDRRFKQLVYDEQETKQNKIL